MKKFYVTLIVLLCFSIYSTAQVIDLVGVGMVDESSKTLTFTDPSSIDAVTVGAIYKGLLVLPSGDTPDGTVNFNGTSGAWMTDIIDKNPTGDNPNIGYWTKDFSSVSSVTAAITNANDEPYVLSFYAYIYRTIPGASYISYESNETVFFYHNGSADPYVYNIPIGTAAGARDITVKIPISELDDTFRMVVIDIEAGTETLHAEEDTWNYGESFFLGTYTLPDVPGYVGNVTVSIYSPGFDDGNGDSFFVNGVVADVEIIPGGCTLTQGYWKTHGSEGPAGPFDPTWDILGEDTPFFLSGKSYYNAIRKKAKGNAYYMLAHQYIAAELNGLTGADFADADNAFNDATALFEIYTPDYIKKLKGNNPIRKQFINAADILADYNEGTIGPGHCDDGNKSVNANINTNSPELVVYPNPMSNYGTLSFVAAEDATTTIEVYNLLGTRVDILFNNFVEAGSKTNLSIDANKYPKGMYILYIRNGSSVYKEKISVMN